MANENEKMSIIERITNYFKGVKSEWGKITWPERQQVFVETIRVTIIIFLCTVLVYIIDIAFKFLFDFIAKQVG